jgi:hypothetical protein
MAKAMGKQGVAQVRFLANPQVAGSLIDQIGWNGQCPFSRELANQRCHDMIAASRARSDLETSFISTPSAQLSMRNFVTLTRVDKIVKRSPPNASCRFLRGAGS